MKRWVLLEHKVYKFNEDNIHYDILFENGSDCLTWKIFQIPKFNGNPVPIFKQDNHRLVWLSTEQKILSRGRGSVKRIDFGTFTLIDGDLSDSCFSVKLDGNILSEIFYKNEDLLSILPMY